MKYLLLAALLFPQAQDNPHQRKWAVRFEVTIPPTADVPEPPLVHLSLLVKAPSESSAAIAAMLQAQELLMIDAQKRLKFVDACLKEEK